MASGNLSEFLAETLVIKDRLTREKQQQQQQKVY